MGRHGYAAAIGQDSGRVVCEFLDKTENIIPAAAIQAGGMLPQLVENFVQLECGQNRLNQNGGFDSPALDAKRVLSVDKHIIPEARFEVTFHLWQIEIRAAS